MDKLLTPTEAARIAREYGKDCTPGTMRSWMADRKVPGAFPFGSTYLVAEKDLRTALEQNRVGVRAEPEGNGPPVITSKRAQKRLRRAGIEVSHVTVLDWLRKGILPGQKKGKAWAVPRAELERKIAEGFEVPTRGRPPVDASV